VAGTVHFTTIMTQLSVLVTNASLDATNHMNYTIQTDITQCENSRRCVNALKTIIDVTGLELTTSQFAKHLKQTESLMDTRPRRTRNLTWFRSRSKQKLAAERNWCRIFIFFFIFFIYSNWVTFAEIRVLGRIWSLRLKPHATTFLFFIFLNSPFLP
jgi:hypothetical protein